MRESNNGKTVGITLRIDKRLLQAYTDIASRANLFDIKRGRPGMWTVQAVMRHRLASAPAVKNKLRR